MRTRKIFNEKEILHNLDYEAISVTVDKTTTGTVDEGGRKILKAGTFLAGDGKSIFEDRTKKVKKLTNDAAATYVDGVALHDVDLTDGDAVVACVFKDTLREDKCNNGAAVEGKVKEKLNLIKFVKGV